MREIKFRFFDTTNKVMSGELSLERIAFGFSQESVFNPNRKEVITMQFTGLLDKNGKEIWEGDVYIHKGCFCRHPVKNTLFFIENLGLQPNEKIVEAVRNREIEVLGNIYENKDLLPTK